MRRLFLVGACLVSLCGCAVKQHIAMFTQQDATQAAAVAMAAGNSVQAGCFSAIGTVVAPIAAGTSQAGLLTLFAEKFALQSVLEGPQCAQTSLGILLTLLPKPAGL